MADDTLVQYYVRIKAENSLLDLSTEGNADKNQIVFCEIVDNIFEMYPQAMFAYVDKEGTLVTTSPFQETLKFTIGFSKADSSDTLYHDFNWAKSSYSDIYKDKHVFGMVLNQFASYNRYYNTMRSDIYPSTNPTAVAQQIVSQYGNPSPTTYVTQSGNTRTWYQGGKTDYIFLTQILTKYAISSQNNRSPFIAFFNLKNEFHFRSIHDLYNNIPAVRPTNNPNETTPAFTVDFSNSSYIIDLSYVQKVNSLTYMGNSVTNELWNVEFNSIVGTEDTDDLLSFKDYKVKNTDKLPYKYTTNLIHTQNAYIGIYTEQNRDLKQAHANSYFVNSMFPLVMEIKLYFNPQCVSGRIIRLTCYNIDGNVNNLLSGEWLIVTSKHRYDLDPDLGSRVTFTHLTLAKNGLNLSDPRIFLLS